MPWDANLSTLRARFSPRPGQKSPHAVAELEAHGLFHMYGEHETAPVPFVQSIDDFITGLHSRSQCARERMGEPQAADFDRQVKALLLQFHPDGLLLLQVSATVTWGKPEGGMAR
jgi:hypothetical protein